MRRLILRILIILAGIILVESLGFYIWFSQKKIKLQDEFKTKTKIAEVKKGQDKERLTDDFNRNKYLATGKNVYERIHNKQTQDIITLIFRLSDEALPDDWSRDVTVEEFTNFILLIQIKNNIDKPSANQVAKHIVPVVRHSYPYLKNVAVFDRYHNCYLYFDEDALRKLMTSDAFGSRSIKDIEQKGDSFIKLNSIKIDFQQIEGHIFIPTIVGGVYECLMMLDTGASTTVISKESAGKTSYEGEDWSKLKTRTFSTAKGLLTCPILKRNISVGPIDRDLYVAINVNDELNLLGVDFFKNYDYTIDSKDKCIYIWNR